MTDTAVEIDRPTAPVECRRVSEFEVRWKDRVIELVAVPYDQEAIVEVHGRMVRESHAPGAYDGVERRANRVKVNRDHDYQRTVGRATALHPSRQVGLVTELRIARTDLGDETLALAEDHDLEPSVGFAVMPGGEEWLDRRQHRRVTKAFLDHIAMVPEGAYGMPDLLSVRSAPIAAPDPVQRPITPHLDEARRWLASLNV